MLHGSLDDRGIWGRTETSIRMAESLHCSSETITTQLTGAAAAAKATLKYKNFFKEIKSFF